MMDFLFLRGHMHARVPLEGYGMRLMRSLLAMLWALAL